MPGLNNTASGASKRKNSGLDSHRCPSAIQHHRDSISQTVAHVLRGGGRKFGETIGARRGDGNAGFANQRLRDRMGGHPNTYRIQSRGQPIRHVRLLRQHQRQRPGPKFPGQFFGALRPLAHQATRHFDRTHMNNQRARRRPAFRGVDFFNGRWIERVGSQPVHRLRRKCYQFARADQSRGAGNLAVYSGRSSFPSPAILPVCLKTRNACISRSRSPSNTRSTSPIESLVR